MLLGLLFASCGNDDDGGGVQNQFTLNGETFTITGGELEDFGSNGNGSFDWDVTLFTKNLNSNTSSGIGELVYLDLNTGSSTGLEEGRYDFGPNRDVFTMVDGSVVLDFDFATSAGTIHSVTGGSVDISLSGSQTLISFSLRLSNGQTATGSFSGVLQ